MAKNKAGRKSKPSGTIKIGIICPIRAGKFDNAVQVKKLMYLIILKLVPKKYVKR